MAKVFLVKLSTAKAVTLEQLVAMSSPLNLLLVAMSSPLNFIQCCTLSHCRTVYCLSR